MLTVEVELPRDFFQFRNAPEVGCQLLYVAAVESLARFDELQVVLLKFSALHRLLFLLVVVTKLFLYAQH